MKPLVTLTSHLTLTGAALALVGGVLPRAPVHAAPSPATHVVAPLGNAINGARLYQACMGCHSLNENDVGPKHRGVVGRKAGSVPGYAYSPALKNSGIVWTSVNLDRWLTNPQKLVPGTKMFFSIPKPNDRADIIAFLAQQK